MQRSAIQALRWPASIRCPRHRTVSRHWLSPAGSPVVYVCSLHCVSQDRQAACPVRSGRCVTRPVLLQPVQRVCVTAADVCVISPRFVFCLFLATDFVFSSPALSASVESTVDCLPYALSHFGYSSRLNGKSLTRASCTSISRSQVTRSRWLSCDTITIAPLESCRATARA